MNDETQVNYMNEHDLVGMSLVMTMDPNVLNEKDGRRAVRRRFVDQLEIAASTGVCTRVSGTAAACAVAARVALLWYPKIEAMLTPL